MSPRQRAVNMCDREVFICGPQLMMKAVAAALGELHVLESSIHYEQFA